MRHKLASVALAAAALVTADPSVRAQGSQQAQRPAAQRAMTPAEVAQTYSSTAWVAAAFRAPPAAEAQAVASVYGGYLRQNPGLTVETALVSLHPPAPGASPVASLLVRFSQGGCRVETGGCRVALLFMRPTGWEPILTADAVGVEVERPDRPAVRGGNWPLIRVNGRDVMEATPGGYYSGTAWGSGTAIVGRTNPRTLPVGAPRTPADWFAEDFQTPRGTMTVMRSVLCTDEGCEIAAYLPPSGGSSLAARVLGTVAAGGRVSIRQVSRQNMPDILVDGQDGMRTWTWNQASSAYVDQAAAATQPGQRAR